MRRRAAVWGFGRWPEEAAQDLDYAALSALAHLRHPKRAKIAGALLQALRDLPPGTAVSYHQLMRAVLGPVVEEATMLKPNRLYVPETIALVAEAEERGRADGEERGRAEGEQRGRAEGEERGELRGQRGPRPLGPRRLRPTKRPKRPSC
jgi:hypothetical protein